MYQLFGFVFLPTNKHSPPIFTAVEEILGSYLLQILIIIFYKMVLYLLYLQYL
jgi:hypothetical protein